MTEAEWRSCDDWLSLLLFVIDRLSVRRGQLYLCAGLRGLGDRLYADASRSAVAVVERAADGQAEAEEVRAMSWEAETPTFELDFDPAFIRKRQAKWGDYGDDVRRLIGMGVYAEADIAGAGPLGAERDRRRLLNAAHIAYHTVGYAREGGLTVHLAEHLARQPEWPGAWLVREVAGDPFRPPEFDPRWRTADVVGLARAIYDDRAFERMPILADALMDAGCEEEAVISHCRDTRSHVRGCWVLDLVLDKV
jgi:hypothetical protein